MGADLDGDVVPVRQPLLHVVGNVNWNLDEESNSQPANHGIPPEETPAVWQQNPHGQRIWDDVACVKKVSRSYCHVPS